MIAMVESFARLLKRHRVVAGLSQERLGELSGVSANAISALERGARRAPYKATLDLLIEALALDDTARREIEDAANSARAHRPQAQGYELLTDSPDKRSVNNLSPQITTFVGRESDVADIKERLQSHRFVTLVGTGGCGKTRCAIEVARGILDDYEDGVWLAELAAISDPAMVGSLIAGALSLREAADRPMLDTLLAFLKRKRLLLVLDNCEHVIDEARRVVAAILQTCPDVRVLATSRESFSIAGEQAYRLPSLAVPSAMQLFCDRAAAADNQFALSLEAAPHVADICKRLDGIPLAIELAAARITVLSPQQLAQKLGERFRLLTAGDRTAKPRHQTMQALIDWSYDLLSDDERRLFRKLSIFTADFTLELAAAVCRDDDVDEIAMLDLLSSLVDKSLVQTQPSAGARRYRLLESTREYARKKLTDAGEESTLALEHARVFLELAEQLRDAWQTTPDRVWLAQAKPVLENFRGAISWALGAGGDVLLGQRLTAALEGVWYFFSPSEGRRWVQAAQQQVKADTPAGIVAALDLAEGTLGATLGRRKDSLHAAERALVRYRELADLRGTVAAERIIGQAQILLGEIAEGEARLEEVMEAAGSMGARRLFITALHGLAMAREVAGDLPGARQRYNEALAAARTIGAEESAANIATSLAEAEFRDGDAAAALRLATEALTILSAVGNTTVRAARYNVAAYLVALGRYDEARIAARDGITASRDAQSSLALAFALQHLAATGALRPGADAQGLELSRRSARILGCVDARLAALEMVRDFTERQEYDAMIPALRGTLGENELLKLLAEGSTWNEDQVVAEAMLI
jgi:predicted ATPase/DNA-binding XRE family transcriptional regulator